MAGPDATPDAQAQQAQVEAAIASREAAEAETKARLLEVQGYVDPMTEEATGQEDTDSQTVESDEEQAATESVDLDAMSDDEYEAYVGQLTPEELRELARNRAPVRGTKAFSRTQNALREQTKALALAEQEYQQELQRLASQLMVAPTPAPAPKAEEADAGWKDPSVIALEREVAELKARDAQREAQEQQRSVAEGLGAIGSEMHKLAEEHPFFAGMGAIGAQKLFAHMQALNTPNTKVAFKDLFETEIDAEKEARIVEKLRGKQQKAASLPHVAPAGTSRRQPDEIPRTKAGKREQMRKAGIGERLQEFFNR